LTDDILGVGRYDLCCDDPACPADILTHYFRTKGGKP
jgi:hypothetical protein